MNQILIYIGAGLSALWGVSHLFPTRGVVKGFGEISADNRHIITMEWIVEGVALIFIGITTVLVTFVDPFNNISLAVYLVAFAELIVLAVVSLFTGFKVKFFMFKLCPVIFTISGVLIILGGFL
jgi:hypothetical protein